MYSLGVLTFSLVLLTTALEGAVLPLQNADFETQGGDALEAANWTFGESGHNIGITREGWAARSGSAGVALHGWTSGEYGFAFQDVAVDINDGNRFSFTIWALAEEDFRSSADELYIKLEMKDGGSIVEQTQLSIYNAAIADTENWNQYTVTHNNSNPNVDSVTVVFGGGQFNPINDGGWAVKFDDSQLQQFGEAVPEPGVLALWGFGMLIITQTRRKLRA
jgi:hypothetical protein